MIGSALVTGASGFVGSALVSRLAATGVPTVALLREGGGELPAGLPATVERLRTASFARRDLEVALAGRRADVVFHVAAHGVEPGQREPLDLVHGNVDLVLELLLATRTCAPRLFVHTGTWSEYGPLDEPARLTETSPVDPRSAYGAAKAAAFHLGRAVAADLGVVFVNMRLFHVYGPGEREHRLIPYLVRQLRRGEECRLTGGEQARDMIYVDDAVEAFLAVGEAGALQPGAYNVCTGRVSRVREVAELVADAISTPRERLGLGRIPYRSDEPMWAIGDPARLHAATGWAARTPLADGVARAVRHELGRPA